MADIKNRDLVSGTQSEKAGVKARSVDRYSKFDDEIQISEKDFDKRIVSSRNQQKSTANADEEE